MGPNRNPLQKKKMTAHTLRKTAILGAGSWGTALSMAAAESGDPVALWSPDAAQIAELAQTRRNPLFHGLGDPLPANVLPTTDLNEVLEADLILVVVPSVAMRSVAQRLRDAQLDSKAILVSCTKGIEKDTCLRMTQVLKEYLPEHRIGALAGPNHAEDICQGLFSATVIGFQEEGVADIVQHKLATHYLRIYSITDLIGMEFGGTLKNVYALGAGICQGLGLGDNAKAALVSRGLGEITRIGQAYGGSLETFMGLSGMGDLIVTCYSDHSRNLRVGRYLADGMGLEEALNSLGMVAEGVPNTLSGYQLARKVNARTPILDVIYAILYEGLAPEKALTDLIARDLRSE